MTKWNKVKAVKSDDELMRAVQGSPNDETVEVMEYVDVMETGETFKGAKILLETKDSELVDQFKIRLARMSRALYGDFS